MSALERSGPVPATIYYPLRRGVAVTAAHLRVGDTRFAIRDLAGAGRLRGRRPASWQLWAYHRGVPTLLWVCRDATEFGQVCRALQRAIEAHRERTGY